MRSLVPRFTLAAMMYFAMVTTAVADTADDVDILRYQTRITPDFRQQSVEGRTEVTLKARHEGVTELVFPLHDLTVSDVSFDGRPAKFRIQNAQLIVGVLLSAGSPTRTLVVSYRGKPAQGLKFGENYVYTAFDTCHWMLCLEESGAKAAFRLELIVPKAYQVIASGRAVSKHAEGDRVVHAWEDETPYSPYLFGFAAGEFTEAAINTNSTELRFLDIGESPDVLKKKFQDTERMLHFFEERAGVRLPHKTYTQLLVPGSAAQEMSTWSVIGRSQLDPILVDPQEDWVIAHELAHQWWGNLITCKSWTHFWLNEGLVVFMTAAYKEQRWGRAAYDREMDLAARRHQTAVAANFDVPLAWTKGYPSLQIKRAITYSKGALFMDVLRRKLGDEMFWKGVRAYTQQNLGRTVESRDFQAAMEKASGQSLAALFDKWVFETPPAPR